MHSGNKKYPIANFMDLGYKDIVSEHFRVFTPVKPEKHRKLNSCYGFDFNMYEDFLMDYPSIIGAKLSKPWQDFNKMLTTHIGICNFRCWHCYNYEVLLTGAKSDYLTANQVVDEFLEKRQEPGEGRGANILRISGGEPLLYPQLIVECLERIQEMKLDDQIFLWSETNMSPTAHAIINNRKEHFYWVRQMGKYHNFALHPCFHGITDKILQRISKVKTSILQYQFEAIRFFINNRIQVYPTFGSNVNPPGEVPAFFNRVRSIHPNLPLLFALIKYDLDYEPVKLRLEGMTDQEKKQRVRCYDEKKNLDIWDKLLKKYCSAGYAERPRHTISLD